MAYNGIPTHTPLCLLLNTHKATSNKATLKHKEQSLPSLSPAKKLVPCCLHFFPLVLWLVAVAARMSEKRFVYLISYKA